MLFCNGKGPGHARDWYESCFDNTSAQTWSRIHAICHNAKPTTQSFCSRCMRRTLLTVSNFLVEPHNDQRQHWSPFVQRMVWNVKPYKTCGSNPSWRNMELCEEVKERIRQHCWACLIMQLGPQAAHTHSAQRVSISCISSCRSYYGQTLHSHWSARVTPLWDKYLDGASAF